MSTLLAIMSLPFWFYGAVFTFVGIAGNTTVNGVAYRGKYRWLIKFIVTLVGLICFAIAYAMV